MSDVDINYNGNDALKKLVEDEGRAGLLKRMCSVLPSSQVWTRSVPGV